MEIPEELRQRCEVWTRVMGYHRPVASFNTGEKAEYADRQFSKEPDFEFGTELPDNVIVTSMGEVYEEDLGYLRFTGVSPQGEEEIDIKDL